MSRFGFLMHKRPNFSSNFGQCMANSCSTWEILRFFRACLGMSTQPFKWYHFRDIKYCWSIYFGETHYVGQFNCLMVWNIVFFFKHMFHPTCDDPKWLTFLRGVETCWNHQFWENPIRGSAIPVMVSLQVQVVRGYAPDKQLLDQTNHVTGGYWSSLLGHYEGPFTNHLGVKGTRVLHSWHIPM